MVASSLTNITILNTKLLLPPLNDSFILGNAKKVKQSQRSNHHSNWLLIFKAKPAEKGLSPPAVAANTGVRHFYPSDCRKCGRPHEPESRRSCWRHLDWSPQTFPRPPSGMFLRQSRGRPPCCGGLVRN